MHVYNAMQIKFLGSSNPSVFSSHLFFPHCLFQKFVKKYSSAANSSNFDKAKLNTNYNFTVSVISLLKNKLFLTTLVARVGSGVLDIGSGTDADFSQTDYVD